MSANTIYVHIGGPTTFGALKENLGATGEFDGFGFYVFNKNNRTLTRAL